MLCTNCRENEVIDPHEVWCEDCIEEQDELDNSDDFDDEDFNYV